MKRWYVIQVYAGYEQAALADLQKRIRESNFADCFGEILIPSVQLKQLFAEADEKSQQLFPGYILIEMEMKPETHRVITSSSRVSRFLGGQDPMPLSKKEVARIISQIKGEITVEIKKEDFTVGTEVDIQDGPFAGFVGVIDKVDQEAQRLSVMVSIFGRMTPVELSFSQVKQ